MRRPAALLRLLARAARTMEGLRRSSGFGTGNGPWMTCKEHQDLSARVEFFSLQMPDPNVDIELLM